MAVAGNVLTLGDFNHSDVNWSSLTSTSLLSGMLCDFVFDNNLSQMIYVPTHLKGNCLDLVLANSSDNVGQIHVCKSQLIISDHF